MTQQLIVYERAPMNAPSLARVSALELKQVRGLQQVRSAIEQAPLSVVACEVRFDNFVQVTAAARWAKSRFPLAMMAMPNRLLAQSWDVFLYESGVDLIFRSNLDLHLAKRLIQRQCWRKAALPDDCAPVTFHQQIWQRLPWKRHASGGRS